MAWIKYLTEPESKDTIGIVGSPGLRSIGKIAVDHLIRGLKPKLVAELYSRHFPVAHETKPSYAPHPDYPGQAGVELESGKVELPKVEFYLSDSPRLLITKGYHASYKGQYEVASEVLDLFSEFGVRKMVVLAGYGTGGKEVCCAATDSELIKELKAYDIDTEYEGQFYGFSGLVFGLGTLRNIPGICLFGRTQPNLDDPESPDPQAAKRVLEKVSKILNLPIQTQNFA